MTRRGALNGTRVGSHHASGAAAAGKIADNCGFHPKPRFYPRTSAMDFSIKACDWSKGSTQGFLTGKSDCIVIGVFASPTLSGAALEIDTATKGLLTRIIKAGDMDGKNGSTLFLHEVSGIGASRVLLVGLGKQDAFSQQAYGEAVRAAWRALLGTKVVQVTFTLAQLPVLERTSEWCVRAAILALRELTYRFTQMKSKA